MEKKVPGKSTIEMITLSHYDWFLNGKQHLGKKEGVTTLP